VPNVARVDAAPRQRVSAAERRDALIDAAIEEFAISGLHGTPVERIARRVGVTQPYVFSLFATKRDLFIAAMERCFETVSDWFTQAAEQARADATSADIGEDCEYNPVLSLIGAKYVDLLVSDRRMLMAQLQAYAACNDEVIREQVQRSYQALVEHVKELAGIDDTQAHEFMSFGSYLTIQAAMGATDLVALKEAHKAVVNERQAAAASSGD
jgi:AcrR family transcriptional regulator